MDQCTVRPHKLGGFSRSIFSNNEGLLPPPARSSLPESPCRAESPPTGLHLEGLHGEQGPKVTAGWAARLMLTFPTRGKATLTCVKMACRPRALGSHLASRLPLGSSLSCLSYLRLGEDPLSSGEYHFTGHTASTVATLAPPTSHGFLQQRICD